MSTIAGASNTIDWLTSAWADIQSQSSGGTGIAIVDALSSSSSSLVQPLDDGLSINDGDTLASQLASIQDNVIQQQGMLAGQAALTRVQDAAKAKQQEAAALSAGDGTDTPTQESLLADFDAAMMPGSIVDTTV
jgi:hypothetical protein